MSKRTPENSAAAAAAFDAFLQETDPEKARVMSDNTGLQVDVVPTGAPSLDVGLGVGGLPRGRITELFGTEGGGKTSLAIATCAQAQKAGGFVGIVDAEHAMSVEFAADVLGLDPSRAVIAQPDTGEEALEMVRKMSKSNAFDVVLLDSVAALVPMREVEGEIGDQNVALLARMMSQGMRILTPVVNKSNTAAIFINQIREKPGQLYGNPEVTPGGRALKFHASVRLEVRSPASARIAGPGGKKDAPIGQNCRVKIVKNKVGPPYRTADYDLYYDTGIDQVGSLLAVAEQSGLIVKNGNTYSDALTGDKLGVGAKQLRAHVDANPDMVPQMLEALYDRLAGRFSLPQISANASANVPAADDHDDHDVIDADVSGPEDAAA